MNRTRFTSALAMVALAAILLPSFLHAQITFQRTYGGSSDDYGQSVQPTTDGGYIIAGYTNSFGAGDYDVYLVKTDSLGDTAWTKTFGGAAADEGYAVQQTSDGGYMIAGFTTSFGQGYQDVYLVKTDANGDTLWTRTYGGGGDDEGWAVRQTTDGGYVIAGHTTSFGAGLTDVYLIRTYANGDTLWTRTFGRATYDDYGYSVQQTADGGYIIAGYTHSGPTWKPGDAYLIKIDAGGDTQWIRTYGSTVGDEIGYSVLQTADSDYVIAGVTNRDNRDVDDFYLIKTDASGDTLWTRICGSSTRAVAYSFQQTSDGGYIIAGLYFIDGPSHVYLVRTDSSGNSLWAKTFGGHGMDVGYSVQQTSDGGHIIAGYTNSYGAGGADVWLIKTDSLGNVATSVAEPKASPTRAPVLSLSCEPNPSSGTTRISLTPQASSSKPLTLRMYDSQGRVVLTRQVPTSSFPLSTSDLPSGVYIIRCDAAGEHASTRIVLQR